MPSAVVKIDIMIIKREISAKLCVHQYDIFNRSAA